MDELLKIIESTNPIIFSILIAAGFIFLIGRFVNDILLRGFKFSLRIAVLGLPTAGKTSMITTVFDSIMSGRFAKNVSVNGSETVDRITHNLHSLRTRGKIGQTKDEDVFAYRYTVDNDFVFMKRKYDIEIADFPGEYTEEFGSDISIQKESKRLFKKEFFSWVVRADRYIFAIDSEAYFKRRYLDYNQIELNNYITNIEILFKNAVYQLKQELLDEKVYNRPVMIVFTKCDCLAYSSMADPIQQEGLYRSDVDFIDMDETALNKKIDILEADFSNIISFMRNNFKYVYVVAHSSYSNAGLFKKSSQKVFEFSLP